MEKINNLDIAAFVRDGAICLRNIFDHTWIERIRDAVDRDMANPGPLSDQVWQGGRFLNDNFMWTRDADFRAFIFESPAATIGFR